jgi:alginate O-acetyltransferase complex protein AlgJ
VKRDDYSVTSAGEWTPPPPDPIGTLAQLPEARADCKVVRGKDGWLFLDNDSNDFMKQQRGELLFTDDQLAQWRAVLEARIAWLRSRGVPYHFLVAPNPHSVYPEMLPFDIAPGTPRPMVQLIDYLTEVGSPAQLLHPLDRLVEFRGRPVFTQTNTHWTDLGGFIAYEALMDQLGEETPVRRLRSTDVIFHEYIEAGDLGHKIEPAESSPHIFGMPKTPVAQMTADNRVFLNGRRVDYECREAGSTVCLVLGDSFALAMLPFLAESFGRLVFAHLTTLDRQLVTQVEPDIVVSIMNERFMIQVPVDEGAKTLEELASEKRARGVVYPPRVKAWTRVDAAPPWAREGRYPCSELMTAKTTTVSPEKASVALPNTIHSARILCSDIGELEVIAEVSKDDVMYQHASIVHGEDAMDAYLLSGADALRAVVLAMIAARKDAPRAILDFGAGHGRVLRMFRAAFPRAELTACEMDRGAVDFCARTFGARGVYSTEDPAELDFDRKFDLIWCGSVFTHYRAEACEQLLDVLASRALAPGGLLVFSTSGRQVEELSGETLGLPEPAFKRLVATYRREGFGFEPYSGASHAFKTYGLSMTKPRWILDRLAERPELTHVSIVEGGWWKQDVTSCVLQASGHETSKGAKPKGPNAKGPKAKSPKPKVKVPKPKRAR